MLIVTVKILSGEVFTFELDDFFVYNVKKIRYLMSRELRRLPQNLVVFKDGEIANDSDKLTEEVYTVLVNV